jgi:uncharacterized protein YjbJ (UPF0337 family)
VNKNQAKGKVKDIAGRVERQAGEWTDDPEAQVRGTAKQAEGKVQKAWGDVKESLKKTADRERTDRPSTDDTAELDEKNKNKDDERDLESHRKAS